MNIKVLLIDDTEEIISYVAIQLNSLGITNISKACNGAVALKCFKHEKDEFDLIFVDLHMPEMDGVEFINKLASLQFRGAIVIMSSLDKRLVSLVADTTRLRNLNILCCMDKPITENKVKNCITKYNLLFHEKTQSLSIIDKQKLLDYIDSQSLVPYFQPKINKSTATLHGFEMVARISTPGDIELIFPDSFISVAEDSELIEKISFILIDLAFEKFTESSLNNIDYGKISVNISPTLLIKSINIDTLHSLAKKYKLPPSQVIFEITEQKAVDKVEQLESLSRLRIKGYGLSLDDYGTGYTNVQQLKNLPYTEIKIDRSLIFNICDDTVSQVIVNSILDVAKELGIDVVAEGIEKGDDLIYLSNLNYELILQGYIFSKPKPFSEAQEWCQSWKNKIELLQTPKICYDSIA